VSYNPISQTVGSVNYILAGDGSAGIANFAAYANGAVAAPTTGTGGSPTAGLFVRNLTSPLRGIGDFVITKTAAINEQGMGVAYPIVIDDADKGQQLSISFDYKIKSGTYITGNIAVYVIDTVNGTVIQPSGYQVINVGANSRHTGCVFQTAVNSNSYKVCWHITTTSTTAFQLQFDNIFCGPQVVPTGTKRGPIGSVVYLGSAVAPDGYLAAHGTAVSRTDYAKLFAVIGTTFGVGDGSTTFNLPDLQGIFIRGAGSQTISGQTFTGTLGTKQTDQFQGHWHQFRGGSSYNLGSSAPYIFGPASGTPPVTDANANYTNSLNSAVRDAGSDGTNGTPRTGTQTHPANIGLNAYICFDEGTVITSDNAATRVVAASILGNPNSTITASYSDVTWAAGSMTIDTHGAFTRTTGSFLVPVPGYYKCSANFELSRASGSPTQYGVSAIKNVTKSQTIPLGRDSWVSSGSEGIGFSGSALIYADAGDTLRFQVASQGTGPAWSAAVAGNFVSIEQVQGPAQIQAATVVAASAGRNATQSLANATTTAIVFDSKTIDTTNSFSTSTGLFTCPAPGVYEVTGNLQWAGHNSGLDYIFIWHSRLGNFAATYHTQTAAFDKPMQSLTAIVNCITGDQIGLQALQNSGAAVNIAPSGATYTNIHIRRLSGVN
jgi:microcystin-dependent protein